MKIVHALILVVVALFVSGLAGATNLGTDACGLTVHSCSVHQNGKYYTESIAFHSGMHAYQTDPACNYTGDGQLPPSFSWQVTSPYRVMPYSQDLHVSGTCPNCTYKLYCGTDASHVSNIETD